MDEIKTTILSISSIFGIELLHVMREISEPLTIVIQLTIGILTIVYLIKKIRRK